MGTQANGAWGHADTAVLTGRGEGRRWDFGHKWHLCQSLLCPVAAAGHSAVLGGLGVPRHQLWHVLKRRLLLAPWLQVHGQKAAWEDPVEWVRDTLPWPSAQQDQSKLYHLPPPTIGPHSTVSPPEERTVKDTTPSSLDSDPLVRPCCAGRWAGRCWWRGESKVELHFPSYFSV